MKPRLENYMRILSASAASGAPSIFSVRWFQFLLGGLLALLITVLLVPYAAERGAASVLSAVVLEPVSPPRFGMTADDAMAQPVTPSLTPTPTGGDGAEDAAGGPYRVQVGTFSEPAEANRLAERLRGEGFPVLGEVVEKSRWLYRILVAPPPGGGQALMAEPQELGLSAAADTQRPSAIGPLPLRKALSAAHRLAAAGIEVRLIREIARTRLHAVRVGGFATPEAAEQARRDLAGRGLDGFVIREGP